MIKTAPTRNPLSTKSLLDLPLEVKTILFTHLDQDDLLNLSHTCSDLRDVAEMRIWRCYNLDTQKRSTDTREVKPIYKHDDPTRLFARMLRCLDFEDNDEGLEDSSKLWGALRFFDLRRAITARPQRVSYIRELKYDSWLGDIKGWNGLLAKIWPHLESASIRMGYYVGSRELRHDEAYTALREAYDKLKTAHVLYSLNISMKGRIFDITDHILRHAPNLRRISFTFEVVSEESHVELPQIITPGYTMRYLTHISMEDAHYSHYPWITKLVRQSPNLKSFEVTGDGGYGGPLELSENEQDKTGPPPCLARLSHALQSSKQLDTLVWTSEWCDVARVVGTWERSGKQLPGVRDCTLLHKPALNYASSSLLAVCVPT
jgi:hypothetical protein